MANLRKSLEEMEKIYDEKIEAMVVGQHYSHQWREKPLADENIILSREVGLKKISEEYDSGYGGADCFPFYAWSKSRVFFVSEYDGSTGIMYAPRNPEAMEPSFSGQSPMIDVIRKAGDKS